MSWLNTPNKLHPPIRTDMVRSSEEQFASEPFSIEIENMSSAAQRNHVQWLCECDHIQLKPFPMIVLFNCVWMRNATEYWQFYYNVSGVSSDSFGADNALWRNLTETYQFSGWKFCRMSVHLSPRGTSASRCEYCEQREGWGGEERRKLINKHHR